MLTELVVDGLGVIDHAELHLTPGSSALTGETGAGKTLLVAALGLLLGARSDKTMVRQGSDEARVDARFQLDVSHPSLARLRADEIVDDACDELVLTRTIAADGRSRSRINGRLVTMNLLQEVGRSLIEIAGQNEHHQLGAPAAQRDLLDAFSGDEAVRLAVRVSELVAELARYRADLDAVQDSERDRARELDVLKFEIKEIEEADPKPNESDELSAKAARLEHADAIASACGSATEALKGEGGVGELLATAMAELSSIADKDASATVLGERLRGVAVEVADISDELSRSRIQADPSALASARDRIGVLTRLLRKYGDSEEEVIAYLERAKQRAAALDGSGMEDERLAAAISAKEKEALEAARELSTRRAEAAKRLQGQLEALLADLSLGDATFEAELQPRDLYAGGLETVAFMIAANRGEAPRPLSKVASGGELSRIGLALKLLSTAGTATTLVFDEVDAGVGGEAARAVGRCLAELGSGGGRQVLVVTHLPQVAAFADHQYRVAKVASEDRTASLVEKVDGDRRVEELSRMLAGLPESERAREHAQELLEIAGRQGRG